MDRFTITCKISGVDTKLQLDKKAMPGETGPCFMITVNGCFKGYISRQKNGRYECLGTAYFVVTDIEALSACLIQTLPKSMPWGKY